MTIGMPEIEVIIRYGGEETRVALIHLYGGIRIGYLSLLFSLVHGHAAEVLNVDTRNLV